MSYHHGNLRQTLLDAARAELLRGTTPSAISLRDLARRIGVSANAPYRHFPDRAEMLECLAAEGYREVTAALHQRGQGGAAAVGRVWQRFVAAEPQLGLLMMSTALRDDHHGVLRDAVSAWIAAVAGAMESETGADDPEALLRSAVGCWAAAHGLASLRSLGLLPGFDDWMLPDAGRLAAAAAKG